MNDYHTTYRMSAPPKMPKLPKDPNSYHVVKASNGAKSIAKSTSKNS